jgi:ERCC4-type nuclease
MLSSPHHDSASLCNTATSIFPSLKREKSNLTKPQRDVLSTKLAINPKFSSHLRKGQMSPPVILKVDLVPQRQEREGTGLQKRIQHFYETRYASFHFLRHLLSY